MQFDLHATFTSLHIHFDDQFTLLCLARIAKLHGWGSRTQGRIEPTLSSVQNPPPPSSDEMLENNNRTLELQHNDRPANQLI